MEGLDPNDAEYEHHMMEALWVHQWHNRVNEDLLKRMLRSRDPGPGRGDAGAVLLAGPGRRTRWSCSRCRSTTRTRTSGWRPSGLQLLHDARKPSGSHWSRST